MLRFMLLFLAGMPAGWAVAFYQFHDFASVVCSAVASLLFLTSAVYARPKRMPAQRLEQHLMGLRVVGREGER